MIIDRFRQNVVVPIFNKKEPKFIPIEKQTDSVYEDLEDNSATLLVSKTK